MLRDELVRDVQVHAAGLADAARQHDEQIEAARDLPAPQVSRRRRAPAVRRERGARGRDRFGGLDDLRRRDAGFRFGVLRRELRVLILQRLFEGLERPRRVRSHGLRGTRPSSPSAARTRCCTSP